MAEPPPPFEPHAVWPPIITGARRPRWIFWRDVALTLLMWALLALILWTELQVVWEAVAITMGKSDAQIDLELARFWARMQPLLWMIGGLVVALAMATLLSIRRRKASLQSAQPPALDAAVLAARAGLDLSALEAARQHRIAIVHPEADGRFRVEANDRLS